MPVADTDWPPRAVTMRVLDIDGREVHSARRGDSKRAPIIGSRRTSFAKQPLAHRVLQRLKLRIPASKKLPIVFEVYDRPT